MERIAASATEIMLERVLRAPATGDLARPSEARLSDSDLDQLQALMTQTKAAFPAQEIPPETMDMWAPAWMALALKYGLDSIRTALQAHVMESRFFPLPAELRERLEASRPRRANVFVPTTRREWARLVGDAVAAGMSELSVEDCARVYGADSAKLYRAKLEREGRGGRLESEKVPALR